MLSRLAHNLCGEFCSSIDFPDYQSGRWSLGVQIVLGAYTLWWMWRFKLSYLWNPSEPRQLPYWVPLLGHAQAFFKDSQMLLSRGRDYFGDGREPFGITIAGIKLYIITSPADMSLVYKNTTSLSFDEFIHDLHLAFGMSPQGRHIMWDDSKGKCLIHVADSYHHAQLHPGEHLDDLTDKFLTQIENRLSWRSVTKLDRQMVRSDGQAVLSLYDWCADVLVAATSVVFFGDSLLRIDENLIEDFHDFDDDSWMLTYKYPRFLAGKMYAGKDKNTETFTRYFQLPPNERQDACYYVRSLEARQREQNMADRDIAISIQLFYWVANANAFKICFWLLSYLLHRPTALDVIKKETASCIKNGKVDIESLIRCPRLDAAFQETLRLTSGASSARTVIAPTTLRSRVLQKDTKLIMPYRQLHFDEAVFGPQVREFRPERFLDKDIARSPSFKPFGGGITYCSGRFIAKREVLAFVAVMLHRYDIELKDSSTVLPRLDDKKPTLGVIGPVKGDETIVLVKQKSAYGS